MKANGFNAIMSGVTGGVEQVSVGKRTDGSGSVTVRLACGVELRAEAKDWERLRDQVMLWKLAQGVPFCLNGSPNGFVGEGRATEGAEQK